MSDGSEKGGGSEHPPPPDPERKKRFERAVPELIKRLVEKAVETGFEKLSEQPENLKNLIGELRLPKEVLSDLSGHIDDTKLGLYRVVAKEIRDVLQQTELAEEIAKVLTKLSFEIKTEIRFIPNEQALEDKPKEDGTAPSETRQSTRPEPMPMPKPKVTSEVTIKDRTKDGRDRR